MFEHLLDLLGQPAGRGVRTDNSILLIYPPERELDFREELTQRLTPRLEASGVRYRLLDVTGLPFDGLDDGTIESLCEEEFQDYRWMLRSLAQRTESALRRHLRTAASQVAGGVVIVYGTVALYPLVRFGDLLTGLRDVEARIALAFPGEDREGRLHFLGQPDGGNYLAVRLSWM